MTLTPEQQRRLIADALGFKDADFLKWHDGMYEAQQWLIDRQKEKNDECWTRYVTTLAMMATTYGTIHATVEQKQEAFLKAIGVNP